MNAPLRRVAVAVMVMIAVLLGNATYVQVIKADSLRTDPRNQRVLFDEYSRQRGQISAGGQVLAESVSVDSRYRFLREYPPPGMQCDPSADAFAEACDPLAMAPVTGFYSMQYSSTGLEHAEDAILNGSDDRLFGRRLFDLLSGRDPRGGNVVSTIVPELQKIAYAELAGRGYTGSVVAIEPATGKILALVSTPSYDPNPLASHDGDVRTAAWEALTDDADQPMLNRAVSATYPPGSTFKVVTAAAALADGARMDTEVTAAATIVLPDTTVTLPNFGAPPMHCGPEGAETTTLLTAFALSCNTAFAELAMAHGPETLRAQAEAFGIGTDPQPIPLPVAESSVGSLPDDAAIAQSGIGQQSVALTPLQNAVIAATVANGGMRMHPYLVDRLEGPDLSTLSTTRPKAVEQALSPEIAATLTEMMVESERNTSDAGAASWMSIASKTGTAEHGTAEENKAPHAWYIGFAPADRPQIAIAVIVEDGGDRGHAATGGTVAAPIGRAVIGAALREE